MILSSLSSNSTGEPVAIKRALISVFDKGGLVEFVKELVSRDVEIISTGGTAKALMQEGLKVKDVSEVTGFPEIMDGRVKTLDPRIHAGLLADRSIEEHKKSMKEHGIETIDLLVVNFYPFEQALREQTDLDTIIENIDIGGPAMVRAAAKNHKFTSVISDPKDYDAFLEELKKKKKISFETRQKLAAKAFGKTAYYDSMVSQFLNHAFDVDNPSHFTLGGEMLSQLRYGENPHQKASVYGVAGETAGVASAEQVQGKALSFNNYNDANAAYNLVNEFTEPAVAIIKHANPCGVASGDNLTAAYEMALACDTDSAFGGIIAVNRKLDKDTAREISKIFTEVILAPEVDDEAKDILAQKENLRLLLVKHNDSSTLDVRTIAGGILVQNNDDTIVTQKECKVVTQRQPSKKEWEDMLFAFQVAKHVKSNAIVYACDKATLGIGAGQMSRVDSARIAAHKKGKGECVAASDAFFPFADGLETIIEAGASAVIQPGGSKRDDEVINTADKAGMTMVFTGIRHFKH